MRPGGDTLSSWPIMNFHKQDWEFFVTLSEAKGLSRWAARCFAALSMTGPILVVNVHIQVAELPAPTLVVQEDVVYTTYSPIPLAYAELVKTLGYQRTMQWFPVLPPDVQHPYDLGPYQKTHPPSLTPLPSQLDLSQATMQSIANAESFFSQLPTGRVHHGGANDNWAVNGPRSASGPASPS
jgi:hypothetical protein